VLGDIATTYLVEHVPRHAGCGTGYYILGLGCSLCSVSMVNGSIVLAGSGA